MREPEDDVARQEREELQWLRKENAELQERVTAMMAVMEQMEEYKRLSAAVLNASPDTVLVVDGLGFILAINAEGAMRLGSTPEMLRGRSIFDLIPEELAPERRRWLNEAIENRKPIQFKDVHGGVTYGHRLYPFLDETTHAVRVAINTRDISASEKTLQALRNSERRYKAILEDQTELICRYLPDGRLSYVNEAYARYFGKNRQELINRNFIPHIPEDDLATVKEHTSSLTPEKPVTTFEHRIIMESGGIRWQQWTHRAIFDTTGQLTEYQAVGRDVTKRKLAEIELNENRAFLRQVINTVPDLIFVKDREGRFVLVNKALAELYGASVEDLEGNQGHDFNPHQDETSLFRIEDMEVLDTQESIFIPQRVITNAQGEMRWFATNKLPLAGKDQVLGVGTDITERKCAEDAVKEAHERFITVLDSIDAVIYVADMDTHELLFTNRNFRKVFGEVGSKTCWQALSPDGEGPCGFCTNDKLLTPDGKPTGPCLWEYRNPLNSLWYHVRDRAIRWVDGRMVRMEIATDITDRKLAEAERNKMEQHLRQAQKMQALGTLAGGIAHDFNNMIFAILGFVRLAMKQTEEGTKIFEYLQQVQSAGMRASDLVRQILAFSRRTEQERTTVHVAGLFKEVSKMLRATLPATLDIRTHIDPAVTSEDAQGQDNDAVLGDPTQIHQVLMNLCTNAAHAMRERGGTLTMTLARLDVSPEAARSNLDQRVGSHLELVVSDTGQGIDPAIMEQIFDPFFTTKAPGEGTGMGLSVVHGIVKSHGGTVQVESQLGKGSTFRVLLPLLEDEEGLSDGQGDTVPTGDERILFVDDEPLLVRMASELLSGLGYTVTAKESATEALGLVTSVPNEFDLIITDQTMPDVTGLELAERVRQLRPELPVLLVTGYSEAVTSEALERAGVSECIMKPMVEEQLARAVRRALDSEANS